MIKRIITLGLLLVSLFVITESFAATAIGKVVWIKGSLTANGRALTRGSAFGVGDTLTTDARSQAEVAFTDGALMTFKEGTNFAVTQYVYDKHSGSGVFRSNMASGGFRTITGLVAKNNPANYEVNTPVATIGVRGTDYQAVLANGSLYVVVYSGEVCLDNNQPGNVDHDLINWMSNPAVYMPQVLAVTDQHIHPICPVGNIPIALATIPDFELTEGLSPPVVNFTVAPSFGGKGLTYTLLVSPALVNGDNITINPKTGVVTATNGLVLDALDIYTISVIAQNPCGAAINSFTFTVDNRAFVKK